MANVRRKGDALKVAVETVVDAPIEKVWSAWVTPAEIMQWNFASDDWICPKAMLDLTVGGRFSYRMEARDGSMGFDFAGTFIRVDLNESIEFALDDDRKVGVEFIETEAGVRVVETFDAEDEHSAEQQRAGWQSILDNFKSHVESSAT